MLCVREAGNGRTAESKEKEAGLWTGRRGVRRERDLPGVGVTAITCLAAFLPVIAGILAPESFVFTALSTVVVPITLHRRLFTCFGSESRARALSLSVLTTYALLRGQHACMI